MSQNSSPTDLLAELEPLAQILGNEYGDVSVDIQGQVLRQFGPSPGSARTVIIDCYDGAWTVGCRDGAQVDTRPIAEMVANFLGVPVEYSTDEGDYQIVDPELDKPRTHSAPSKKWQEGIRELSDALHDHGIEIETSDMAILSAIFAYMNRKTGVAWPGNGNIARFARLEKSYVAKRVRHLARRGIIVIVSPGRRDGTHARLKIGPPKGWK